MTDPENKSIYEPLSVQGSIPVELQRMRNAKSMRKHNFEAYGKSFSDLSLIDPNIAPKLNLRQRLYLRGYEKLFQIFMHSYSVLAEIKERREREGIGFQFVLPDPEGVKKQFRMKMGAIIGEGAYDGYERSLAFEQKDHMPRKRDELLIEDWEG